MKSILASLTTILSTLLIMFVITSSPVKADPDQNYYEKAYECANGDEIMRCRFGSGGCEISNQCFCDDLCEF
ncbi:MAG: hypothetical protein ABJM22_12725 [Balneola sp.]